MSSHVQLCESICKNASERSPGRRTGCSSLKTSKTSKRTPERPAVKEQLSQPCPAMSSFVQPCPAMSKYMQKCFRRSTRQSSRCSGVVTRKNTKENTKKKTKKACASYIQLCPCMCNIPQESTERPPDAPRQEPAKRPKEHQEEQQPKNNRSSYVQISPAISSYVRLCQSSAKFPQRVHQEEHQMLLAENQQNAKESTRKNISPRTTAPAMSSYVQLCPAMSSYVQLCQSKCGPKKHQRNNQEEAPDAPRGEPAKRRQRKHQK